MQFVPSQAARGHGPITGTWNLLRLLLIYDPAMPEEVDWRLHLRTCQTDHLSNDSGSTLRKERRSWVAYTSGQKSSDGLLCRGKEKAQKPGKMLVSRCVFEGGD